MAKRIKAALNPFNNSFFDIDDKYKPDLYGPFWVYVTLVFALAGAGNL